MDYLFSKWALRIFWSFNIFDIEVPEYKNEERSNEKYKYISLVYSTVIMKHMVSQITPYLVEYVELYDIAFENTTDYLNLIDCEQKEIDLYVNTYRFKPKLLLVDLIKTNESFSNTLKINKYTNKIDLNELLSLKYKKNVVISLSEIKSIEFSLYMNQPSRWLIVRYNIICRLRNTLFLFRNIKSKKLKFDASMFIEEDKEFIHLEENIPSEFRLSNSTYLTDPTRMYLYKCRFYSTFLSSRIFLYRAILRLVLNSISSLDLISNIKAFINNVNMCNDRNDKKRSISERNKHFYFEYINNNSNIYYNNNNNDYRSKPNNKNNKNNYNNYKTSNDNNNNNYNDSNNYNNNNNNYNNNNNNYNDSNNYNNSNNNNNNYNNNNNNNYNTNNDNNDNKESYNNNIESIIYFNSNKYISKDNKNLNIEYYNNSSEEKFIKRNNNISEDKILFNKNSNNKHNNDHFRQDYQDDNNILNSNNKEDDEEYKHNIEEVNEEYNHNFKKIKIEKKLGNYKYQNEYADNYKNKISLDRNIFKYNYGNNSITNSNNNNYKSDNNNNNSNYDNNHNNNDSINSNMFLRYKHNQDNSGFNYINYVNSEKKLYQKNNFDNINNKYNKYNMNNSYFSHSFNSENQSLLGKSLDKNYLKNNNFQNSNSNREYYNNTDVNKSENIYRYNNNYYNNMYKSKEEKKVKYWINDINYMEMTNNELNDFISSCVYHQIVFILKNFLSKSIDFLLNQNMFYLRIAKKKESQINMIQYYEYPSVIALYEYGVVYLSKYVANYGNDYYNDNLITFSTDIHELNKKIKNNYDDNNWYIGRQEPYDTLSYLKNLNKENSNDNNKNNQNDNANNNYYYSNNEDYNNNNNSNNNNGNNYLNNYSNVNNKDDRKESFMETKVDYDYIDMKYNICDKILDLISHSEGRDDINLGEKLYKIIDMHYCQNIKEKCTGCKDCLNNHGSDNSKENFIEILKLLKYFCNLNEYIPNNCDIYKCRDHINNYIYFDSSIITYQYYFNELSKMEYYFKSIDTYIKNFKYLINKAKEALNQGIHMFDVDSNLESGFF